jgi:hypothetical protein
MDLFYTSGSSGAPILRHKAILSTARSKILKSAPLDLLVGIPPLTYGCVPIMILFSGTFNNYGGSGLFIGDPILLGSDTKQCYSSFALSNLQGGDTFNLMLGQQPEPGDFVNPNAIRNYNPTNTTPGTNVLSLYQTLNDAGNDFGGIFTIYYLDQPLY